jgi:hypothetical protein
VLHGASGAGGHRDAHDREQQEGDEGPRRVGGEAFHGTQDERAARGQNCSSRAAECPAALSKKLELLVDVEDPPGEWRLVRVGRAIRGKAIVR